MRYVIIERATRIADPANQEVLQAVSGLQSDMTARRREHTFKKNDNDMLQLAFLGLARRPSRVGQI